MEWGRPKRVPHRLTKPRPRRHRTAFGPHPNSRRLMSPHFRSFVLFVLGLATTGSPRPTLADETPLPPDIKGESSAVVPVSVDSEISDNPEAASSPRMSLEEALEADPEFASEYERRKQVFSDAKARLADRMLAMRRTWLRFHNGVDKDDDRRAEYRRQRGETEEAMDAAFEAALDLMRIGGDVETAQYLLTAVKERFDHDVYDASTMEAASRLIDSGQSKVYLFLVAARSAMAVGNVDMARRLYEAVGLDNTEDPDRGLMTMASKMADAVTEELRRRELDADLPRVRFVTSAGDVVIELFADDAPSTVAHFMTLVDEGFYDGLDFGQVMPGLLAHTGDPQGDGFGHSGRFVFDEAQGVDARRAALRGTVLMAKIIREDKSFVRNSNSSQFAILFLPALQATQDQTVIGRVVEGMNVVSRMRRVDPTAEKEKGSLEVPPDHILSAEVIRRGKPLAPPNYVPLPGRAAETR